MELLSNPWPWYVGGPMIALTMFLMLYMGKRFGISSSLETICTIGGGGKISSYFDKNWKDKVWLLLFAIGVVGGGFIGGTLLADPNDLVLAEATVQDLSALGISFQGEFLPESIFSWDNLFTFRGFIFLILGGMLIGFGTRYAGGCTSGHAISGLSELQIPSLVATIGFFIGGLISTYFLLPILLN